MLETKTLASSEASVSSSIAYGRRVLNLSPKEALQVNSVKMKSKGQRCLHIEEPENFEDAKTEECWRHAMDEELGSIRDNDTWELADLPNGHNAIELKWEFKIKRDVEGNCEKHKARLVAKHWRTQRVCKVCRGTPRKFRFFFYHMIFRPNSTQAQRGSAPAHLLPSDPAIQS